MHLRKILLVSIMGVASIAAMPAFAASALYRCPLNIDIVADYGQEKRSVTLYTQGQTFRLPPAMSASGARYSDGRTTLWEHQGKATFETTGVSLTDCSVVALNPRRLQVRRS